MIKVVIVDDEMLARVGIRTFLIDKENIVVEGCFSSAFKALEYLRNSGGTDIVISDIEMTGMNGLEFIETIKREQLVIGTIIISSYSDFEYARQALRLETDSYILKQEINEEGLLAEINKIYEQKKAIKFESQYKFREVHQFAKEQESKGYFYQVGVLKIKKEYDEAGEDISKQIDENMLIGLLESVLSNYENGHLFVPRLKEMFVVFKFSDELERQKKASIIEDICYDLQQNMKLYTNATIDIGMSEEFVDFREMLKYYRNAHSAVELQFYESEKNPLYYTSEKISEQVPECVFSADNFLEDEGVERFERELYSFFEQCKSGCVDVKCVGRSLIEKLTILTYKVTHDYSLPETLLSKWNQELVFQAILHIEDERVVKLEIVKIVEQFQTDLLTQLRKEEFSDVFLFVDKNLQEKISLSELAELSCMSTASFCKKFKERTGMTLVQYVNQKKISKVKELLNNKNYTLSEIAERTGFCGENYMVRVFKKVTGQTIRDYKGKREG